ncbi:MAG: AAA domain-containing protein [Bacteroidota bacterium]
MTDLTFLKALREKLKGGNTRSIHLNVLPGRFATRLDVANLNYIDKDFAQTFLSQLFTKSKFEFKISFEGINSQSLTTEHHKKLELLAKRLNSLHIENEDNYKEHGIKTFGFGFPILIKQSKKDPKKFIKAPIFIWNLEIVKSSNKVNTWSILKNKTKGERERIVDDEIHSVGLNEVLLSFLKSDEGINVPQINEELVEDTIIDKTILIEECIKVLQAVNGQNVNRELLTSKLNEQINNIPEGSVFDSIGGNNSWIHFGGVFGLFRTQKESIIADIDKIIERANEFKFENLIIEKFAGTPHSAIETDPSQQEILNTLGSIPNKIIQGPPGTGKSQTLTALITNALANNLKCLVVCEKKTALDVIKNNLLREHEQLGALTAIIEDIDKDRKDIVNSVRERMISLNPSYSQQTNYQLVRQSIEKIACEINNQHKRLDRSIFRGKSWTQLVGEYLKIQKKFGYSILNNRLDQTQFKFHADENEFSEISNKIKTGKRLFTDAKHLNSLEVLNDEIFKRDSPKAVLLELEFKIKEKINEMSKVIELVDEIEQKDKLLFVREDTITNLKVNFQSLFSPSFKKLKNNKQKFKEVAPTLIQAINQENLYQKRVKFPSSLLETLEASQSILHILKETQNSLGDFIEYYNWRKFYLDLNTVQRNVIISLIQENCEDWESAFESWYYFWILSNNEDKELPKSDDKIRELFQVKAQLKNSQIQNIITNWTNKQYASIKRAKARNINTVSLYNKKGAAGQKRNSLRQIIRTDFTLFTDFFPVMMMSPTVCSSILPLTEGIFDLVIFDEASQLRVEDTFPALI